MSYYGTTINESPVIAGIAAADMEKTAFLAVKFDGEGKIAVADEKGKNVLGLLPAEQEDIKAGGTVTVQVKDMGLWKASAAFNAGDELTTTADGKAAKAESGDFITAIALEKAESDGDIVKVQIVKAGYAGGGAAGAATATVKKLSDLSDVEGTDSTSEGYVLKFTSGKWQPGEDQKQGE